ERSHDFRSYGTVELPFGPNKWIGRSSSGWMARGIEAWKFGTIVNITSGAPLSISGRNTLYAAGTPDITGAAPRDGKVVWATDGSIFGSFFPQQYQRVTDPACASIAASLRPFCTNTALADANG